MTRRRGLAFRLSLLIVVGCALVFGIAFGYDYLIVRRMVVRNISENARSLTLTTVNRVDAVLGATAKIPENLAASLEHSHYTEDELFTLLRQVVENNAEVFGAAVAFEPHAYRRDKVYFAPYWYRSQGKIAFTYLGGETSRYFTSDWYQIPKELGRAVWSEPYYPEGGGGIIMSTYSVPFFESIDGNRRFRGVVRVDLSLQWLHSIISAIHISRTGYAFLISRNGVIVTHPRGDWIMNETLFSIAEARNDAALREIGRAMIQGKSGFVQTTALVSDKPCWLAYAPVPANGWALGALFPQDELMADVSRLNRTVVTLAASGLLLLLMFVVLAARSITRPLTALTHASEDLARGNLDTTLPAVTSADEVGRLAGAFGRMQHDLKRYIRDLEETSAARERAAAQLEEYSHTLEQKVDARTRELRTKNADLEATLAELKRTQDQLVVQEKLASLGALVAGIAHEIKNPLNFVTNFAELSGDLISELREVIETQKDRLDPKQFEEIGAVIGDLAQNVSKIHEHSKRADGIVRGMLQHSRGKSGEPVPTDLNALVAEYVALAYHGMRAQDASFNITLDTAYDPSVGLVPVVPQDISRVFLNVINNACYAASEKRKTDGPGFAPTVSVRTTNLGDRVEIRIRDNGNGIPAGVRDKIFNPFFTTKPPGKGTGLGLSISYDIVRQHQGEIRVQTEEGQYTEFVIVLPRPDRAVRQPEA
jgi:signal transduction histidine kinase